MRTRRSSADRAVSSRFVRTGGFGSRFVPPVLRPLLEALAAEATSPRPPPALLRIAGLARGEGDHARRQAEGGEGGANGETGADADGALRGGGFWRVQRVSSSFMAADVDGDGERELLRVTTVSDVDDDAVRASVAAASPATA